jgi:hypothetical protein
MCPEHYKVHSLQQQEIGDSPQQQEIGDSQQQQEIGDSQQQQEIGDSQQQQEIGDSQQKQEIGDSQYQSPNAYQQQHDREIRKNRDSCTDVLFFLAKDTQQKMTSAITNLTLPYVKDLEYFCTINNLIYSESYINRRYNESHKLGRQNKCISSRGSSTFVSENHKCTCEWIVTFDKIKYNKIASKTYRFDIPDEDNKGNIGSITLYHCECHSSGDIYKFGLKPLSSILEPYCE